MKVKGFITLVSLWLALFCCCTRASISEQCPGEDDPLAGQECDPPFGYERKTCGYNEVILSSQVVILPDFLYGPNVCRITETVQTNVLEYRLNEYCRYVYERGHHYHYTQVRRCVTFCMPTKVCTSTNKTIERSKTECCPGFLSRPGTRSKSYNEYLYSQYYTKPVELPAGCPIVNGETLMECLNILQLTEFINLINMIMTESNNTFGLTTPHTVFAPTNEAIESASVALNGMDPTTVVGNHVINATVKASDLNYNQRFQTVLNQTIHSTTVVMADRSLGIFHPQYTQGHNSIRYTVIRYIGGASVVNKNACTAEGVTLHVIDDVLIPEERTIADILRSNPGDFSLFTEALDFAGVLNFLDKINGVSRTVFVPTNDAFQRQIPPDLFACLMYRRVPLNNLVLFHVADSAEFTSSLVQREAIYTLRLLPIRLAVCPSSDPDGNITFLLNPPSRIVVPDITASNGVIHVISDVLIPPDFDFGMCTDLVPTTMTTPPPTTMTTPPPTTMITPPPTTVFPTLPGTNSTNGSGAGGAVEEEENY